MQRYRERVEDVPRRLAVWRLSGLTAVAVADLDEVVLHPGVMRAVRPSAACGLVFASSSSP